MSSKGLIAGIALLPEKLLMLIVGVIFITLAWVFFKSLLLFGIGVLLIIFALSIKKKNATLQKTTAFFGMILIAFGLFGSLTGIQGFSVIAFNSTYPSYPNNPNAVPVGSSFVSGNFLLQNYSDGSVVFLGCKNSEISQFIDIKCDSSQMVQQALKTEFIGENCEPLVSTIENKIYDARCQLCPAPQPITEWAFDSYFNGQGLESRLVKAYKGTNCTPVSTKEYRLSQSTGKGFDLSKNWGLIVLAIAIAIFSILVIKSKFKKGRK